MYQFKIKNKSEENKVLEAELETVEGALFLKINEKIVVRISPDGKVDTCWYGVDNGSGNARLNKNELLSTGEE